MANSVPEEKPSKFSITKVGIRDVLTLKESLTYQNCEELEVLLKGLINQNTTEIILDCKSVSFLDSMALELLIRIHDDLRSRGAVLKIISLNSVCQDILLTTRLINIFNVYKDMHEAIKSAP